MNKICLSSDLHLGITNQDHIVSMLKKINVEKPDLFVVAGDIGESVQSVILVRKCLELCKKYLFCPIAFVVGNHDLWAEKAHNNRNVHERLSYIDYLAKSINVQNLENDNYIVGSTAIVGSYLHYDYSVKMTGALAGYDQQFFIKNKKNVHNDANYLYDVNDIEFSQQLGKGLIDRLYKAQNDSSIEKIVVVTHVSCLDQLLTLRPDNISWSLCTPYFGNVTYQKDILGCSKVVAVFSGHSHVGINTVIDRENMSPVKAVNIGSDYNKPVFEILEL